MKKITQGAPRRRLGAHESGAGIAFLEIWAPGAAPFRARLPCTKVKVPCTKVKRLLEKGKRGI